MESLHPATMAAQALGWVDESTKALIPPVHPSTTFIRDPDNQYRTGYSYGRPTNPTFVQPEALLTKLEGGAACLTFASGWRQRPQYFWRSDLAIMSSRRRSCIGDCGTG